MSAKQFRVLVVDCNEDAAAILGILLRGHGFNVEVECGKASALNTAASFLPDAAIINLGNDYMDTYELAFALRSLPEMKESYLITLSNENVPAPFRNPGFRIDTHLVKPAGYRKLIDVLDTVRGEGMNV